MNPVNWFEIPVTDIDRATKFYEAVLGINLEDLPMPAGMEGLSMKSFPMEWGKPGSSGALVQMESYTPSYEGSLVYFSVTDIDAVIELARQNGGKVVNAKQDIGEYGWTGHFEDCEGNRIGLHTNKPEATT